jgi:hypothetical protein
MPVEHCSVQQVGVAHSAKRGKFLSMLFCGAVNSNEELPHADRFGKIV